MVTLDVNRYGQHGRVRFVVTLLPVDRPFSDNDHIQSGFTGLQDITDAVEFMINSEGHTNLSGYTVNQLMMLKQAIDKLASNP